MSDKIAELILEQLFILQNNCATKGDLKAMEERIDSKIDAKFEEQDKKIDAKFAEQDKKIDAKFAEQAIEISEQFRMAFESADRIHNKMESNINKRNDKKKSQALQF